MPVLMILMYLTPILYPLTLVPEGLRPWVAANPFGWLVDAAARRAARRAASRCNGRDARRAVAALALFFAGRVVFRRLSPHFEDFVCTADSTMTTPLLRLANVGKDYAKVESRGGRVRLVLDLLRGRGAAHVFRALDGVALRVDARRIARRDRRERRRQVDAAQDRRRRDRAHARHRSMSTVASARCSSWDRASIPNTRGSRTSTSPRRCSASRRARSPRSATRSSRSPTSASTSTTRSSTIRPAWWCAWASRSPPRSPRHPHHRRGARGRRRIVPEECIAWMERYLADGGTLLLCSHGMYHVQKLCRSALWLEGRTRRALRTSRRGHAGVPRLSRGKERAGETADRRRWSPWHRGFTRSSRSTSNLRHPSSRGGDLRISGEVFSPDGRAPNVLIGIVRADGTPGCNT